MNNQVKILCVDDEPNVLKSLYRMFMDEDYEIISAESAEEALAVLAKEWDIQVVISDYRMPGMNGVDFLIKVNEGWPETIRIVLSGYADTASVVAAINEGQIYKFIAKPWNDADLKATIDKAIDLYNLKRKNQELTNQLISSNAELKLLNEDLERAVEDRTAELIFRNQALLLSQNILDSLPVAVAGLDPEGFIVQGNPRFHQLLGLPIGSAIGSDMTEIFPGEVVEFIRGIVPGVVAEMSILLKDKPCRLKGINIKNEADQNGLALVIDWETLTAE